MFERPPFEFCPNCKKPDGVGILSVGGNLLTMRCRSCRYIKTEPLPALDKKVIYLDQFAVSNLFKIQSGKWREGSAGRDFWTTLYRKVRRVSLLQQAVFPHSNIHSAETIVSPFASDLRLSYELLGGDVALIDTDAVQRRQVLESFAAYREGRTPEFQFGVDDVLRDRRNEWLPDMHITVQSDYSHLADGIRGRLEQSATELAEIVKIWSETKLPFAETLRRELEAFGHGRIGALKHVMAVLDRPESSEDISAWMDAAQHSVLREFSELRSILEKAGIDPETARNEVIRFWFWSGNWMQPFHRISAYMFAALARKIAAGQKRLPSRGFMNDVNAVAAYAPYVDAMFIDNECAALLGEAPLKDDLKFRAEIFSLNTRDRFLKYLSDIEEATPSDVRDYAIKIYGIANERDQDT